MIWPASIREPGPRRSRIAPAMVLFPDPDSPTRATAAPRRTVRETLRTTNARAASVSYETLRFLISSSASADRDISFLDANFHEGRGIRVDHRRGDSPR